MPLVLSWYSGLKFFVNTLISGLVESFVLQMQCLGSGVTRDYVWCGADKAHNIKETFQKTRILHINNIPTLLSHNALSSIFMILYPHAACCLRWWLPGHCCGRCLFMINHVLIWLFLNLLGCILLVVYSL